VICDGGAFAVKHAWVDGTGDDADADVEDDVDAEFVGKTRARTRTRWWARNDTDGARIEWSADEVRCSGSSVSNSKTAGDSEDDGDEDDDDETEVEADDCDCAITVSMGRSINPDKDFEELVERVTIRNPKQKVKI
jgi:hypothetical protein